MVKCLIFEDVSLGVEGIVSPEIISKKAYIEWLIRVQKIQTMILAMTRMR